jgi:hypothetical protein
MMCVDSRAAGHARARVRGRAVVLLTVAALLGGCHDSDTSFIAGDLVDEDTPADLKRAVVALMPSLQRLSGLDQVETLRLRRQSRADARGYVEQRLAQDLPPDLLDAVRRTYVALGMVPDTLDLHALLLDLYTEQVLGYYDPRTKTMYVVEGADTESLRPVLAHELVHALQDQHAPLDSLVSRERGNDRQTAAHAALEGHAMMVMFAVLAEQASGRRVDPTALPSPAAELGPAVAAQNEQFPVFRRAPLVIRETMLFPYLRGADFVHQLWLARAPQDRYPAPLDSLLPQSTEQIMEPARFLAARDAPVELVLQPSGEGTVLHSDNLGQLETMIFLETHLGAAARTAAAGWGGDRYVLVTDAAGRDVLFWASVWDSASDADRFAAAAERAAARRSERRVEIQRVEVDGRPGVVVVDAPAGGETLLQPHVSVLRN